MREIKFKGKCTQSGDWVYGDLIHGVGHKKGNLYILPNKVNLAYVKHCDPLDGVLINPETIGQYAGLKDKNGKEIYEGDIVDILDPTTKPNPEKCIVKFNERIAAFEGFRENKFSLFLHQPDLENELRYNILKSGRTIEVIGNIHEHPELITKN